jgi:hypothetical protein
LILNQRRRLRSVGAVCNWRLHERAARSSPDSPAQPAAPHELQRTVAGNTTMGKGDKRRGNREAKKPKADKKVTPAGSTFLRPQADAPKPGAKPPSK